jgi:hypothetical protein
MALSKQMKMWQVLKRPPWRTVIPGGTFLVMIWCAYLTWTPGLDLRDGQHDRGHNGLWLAHGWLGADDWFIRNGKTNEYSKYREAPSIRELSEKLHRNHITDVFPHLCPAEAAGHLPSVDDKQVERLLDGLAGIRVMPWVGGPNGDNVRLGNAKWRSVFVDEVALLLQKHPRLFGVHLNVEPLPSGDTNFLSFLEQLRSALPEEKLLSIAAYPPPTRWHPQRDVHWDQAYFHEVARRCDQIVVMMYDAGQRFPKMYQRLMADWTGEVLAWNSGKSVLLGVPTYEDPGVEYHYSNVENITNALLGVHRGLSAGALPSNYQGVAIYAEWETSDQEWSYFRDHFLRQEGTYR